MSECVNGAGFNACSGGFILNRNGSSIAAQSRAHCLALYIEPEACMIHGIDRIVACHVRLSTTTQQWQFHGRDGNPALDRSHVASHSSIIEYFVSMDG